MLGNPELRSRNGNGDDIVQAASHIASGPKTPNRNENETTAVGHSLLSDESDVEGNAKPFMSQYSQNNSQYYQLDNDNDFSAGDFAEKVEESMDQSFVVSEEGSKFQEVDASNRVSYARLGMETEKSIRRQRLIRTPGRIHEAISSHSNAMNDSPLRNATRRAKGNSRLAGARINGSLMEDDGTGLMTLRLDNLIGQNVAPNKNKWATLNTQTQIPKAPENVVSNIATNTAPIHILDKDANNETRIPSYKPKPTKVKETCSKPDSSSNHVTTRDPTLPQTPKLDPASAATSANNANSTPYNNLKSLSSSLKSMIAPVPQPRLSENISPPAFTEKENAEPRPTNDETVLISLLPNTTTIDTENAKAQFPDSSGKSAEVSPQKTTPTSAQTPGLQGSSIRRRQRHRESIKLSDLSPSCLQKTNTSRGTEAALSTTTAYHASTERASGGGSGVAETPFRSSTRATWSGVHRSFSLHEGSPGFVSSVSRMSMHSAERPKTHIARHSMEICLDARKSAVFSNTNSVLNFGISTSPLHQNSPRGHTLPSPTALLGMKNTVYSLLNDIGLALKLIKSSTKAGFTDSKGKAPKKEDIEAKKAAILQGLEKCFQTLHDSEKHIENAFPVGSFADTTAAKDKQSVIEKFGDIRISMDEIRESVKLLDPASPLANSCCQAIEETISLLELRLHNIHLLNTNSQLNISNSSMPKPIANQPYNDSTQKKYEPRPKGVFVKFGNFVIQSLAQRPLTLVGALLVILIAELVALGYISRSVMFNNINGIPNYNENYLICPTKSRSLFSFSQAIEDNDRNIWRIPPS
ncbi:hypothetical protein H4219_004708 [Mycoemilia scoparia]|uniref:Uncharacterized protein n=1 Tax=Mycoemilia scoparia TaxID=417184 RepID=A0A9W8A0A8_9FUNG|nr:hypothetical protein H4219_004708 [Mycoemilia scoparia]